MLDKRFFVTAAAVVTVIMTAMAVHWLPKQSQAIPSREDVSDVEQGASAESPREEQYKYLMKELDGRIAIYSFGSDEPEILDVKVKYLPEYDREQLGQGIKIDSYDRLVALIEDYSS